MLESQFRVIPVLDVKNGQAVHAVGGIRSHYRPLQSLLHPSCKPMELALAYRDLLDLRELYLADLDAISGKRPDLSLYHRLAVMDVHLWIDAGLKDENDLDALVDLDHTTIVVGLETAAGPDAVRAILDRTDPSRVVLSLDLFEGVPHLPKARTGPRPIWMDWPGKFTTWESAACCCSILPASGQVGEPEPGNCS